MFKKLLRALFTILGAILGYGVFQLFSFWATKSGVDVDATFSQGESSASESFSQLFSVLSFSD